jgi:UV DNA damage endonuclease
VQSWRRVGREPYLHLSSPKFGWHDKPKPHADFIDVADFPAEWAGLDATIDVEAKAKEVAVLQLMQELRLPRWETAGCSADLSEPYRAGSGQREGFLPASD